MLCTATLGPPREGRRTSDPIADAAEGRNGGAESGREGDDNDGAAAGEAPVGSLRFLRSQVALESDMNSRRVRAGVEMTGDSGSLSEAKRLHLQVSRGAGVRTEGDTTEMPLFVFVLFSHNAKG